jgi:6-phosphofructokinase 1
VPLDPRRVTDLIARGGTILGSSNRANPFAYPVAQPGGGERVVDVSDRCLEVVRGHGLDGMVLVGGDGTMGMGKRMLEKGMPIVGVPKTIDNDLEATEYTVGFQTAVEVASEAIDRLHTTAESHDRIIICEVMGRYAGWIAMAAGLAAAADVILVPEIPYDVQRVIAGLQRRTRDGRTYALIVVAEGAAPAGGALAVQAAGDATQQERLGGAGQHLADALVRMTDYDVRVTVLGHLLRGGTPCAFDRFLASRFGTMAVDLLAADRVGEVAALRAGAIVSAPIARAVDKLKRVDPAGDVVRTARALGVELGG